VVSTPAPASQRPITAKPRGQQLVVLAEAEVVVGRVGRQRDAFQLEHDRAARARRELARVACQAIRDVEHRMRCPGKLEALGDSQWRAEVPPVTECRTGPPERSSHNESVTGKCTRAPRNPVGVTERRQRDHDALGPGQVAATNRDADFGDPRVELEDRGNRGLGRSGQTDEQRLRLRSRRGEIADIHRGRPEAELTPGEPVEPEMDPLDQGVLAGDEPLAELRCVVLDPLG
jgi:hypothetical protein